MISVFITAALCVIADQVTKYLAVSKLAAIGSVDVIEGVLRLTYVENSGAAFGSLANHRWVFIILSAAMIAALTAYVAVKRPRSRLLKASVGLIIGGGVGNMIDRLAVGYVVDFIDFCAFPSIWKWVFNGADSFVCIGAALLMIHVLLSDKRDSGKTVSDKGDGETDEH